MVVGPHSGQPFFCSFLVGPRSLEGEPIKNKECQKTLQPRNSSYVDVSPLVSGNTCRITMSKSANDMQSDDIHVKACVLVYMSLLIAVAGRRTLLSVCPQLLSVSCVCHLLVTFTACLPNRESRHLLAYCRTTRCLHTSTDCLSTKT